MQEFIKLVLKSGKDQSPKRFHPWIFSGAIKKIYGNPEEGDLVQIYSNKEEYLGIGHYQIGSIAVRIISFEEVIPDAQFWKGKLVQAYETRKAAGLVDNPQTNVYRLVNAEGDGMPGLIIDFYNGTCVFQIHSIGMYHAREQLIEGLKEIFGNNLKAVFDKSDSTIPFKSQIDAKNEYLLKTNPENKVLEYGNTFIIDWEEGQKTGFFIDQRENRRLVEYFSKNRNVLNMFGYTGGFSVYALKGGAETVDTVDSSAKAIDLCKENIKLNFGEINNHQALAVDAFGFMETVDPKYDLIILDPPAFAKHHNVLSNALQGYKRLNAKAISKIKKGGILFTFSCSQVVSKENFRKSVFAAAANTGRKVKILQQLSQPADHPVNIYHPEGEYLKGLVLYVE